MLDAIPPQALLGGIVALGAVVLGKIALIRLGLSEPIG